MSAAGPGGARADVVFVVAITVLSGLAYVGGLGFYSDDWGIVAAYFALPDQSLGSVLASNFPWLDYRPGQALQLSLLYWLFGTAPLGYHLVNLATLAAGAALFYLVLRECALARALALAIALVYVLLPHYATVRYWYASFAAGLGMATYFLSLYADLRCFRPGRLPVAAWRASSLASLLAGLMTYEVFLPLYFLNPLLAWHRNRREGASARLPPARLALAAAPNVLAALGVGVFKAVVSDRDASAPLAEHLRWFADFVGQAAQAAVVGDFGLRLPWVWLGIARNDPDPLIVAGAVLTGALVFAWLWRAARDEAEGPSARAMLTLAGLGALLFVAGYSIFLTNFRASVTTTGADNRTGIAAALGIAVLFVGLAGTLAGSLPAARARRALFAVLVAAAGASGFLVVNTLGRFWAEAATRQQAILDALKVAAPALPPGATLLIDGACRYAGPAPVFETYWDTTGALQILYRQPALTGDVVSPKLRVTLEGVYTKMYDQVVGPYAWRNLHVFDFRRGRVQPLNGPYAATAWLQANDPTRDAGCPPAREGHGERVF